LIFIIPNFNLPQIFQRVAPSDRLVKHLVNRLRLMSSRFEYAKILEVGLERKRNLRANVGDFQLAHDRSQVLDRSTSSAIPSINACWFSGATSNSIIGVKN
jgi:hypothetical protein